MAGRHSTTTPHKVASKAAKDAGREPGELREEDIGELFETNPASLPLPIARQEKFAQNLASGMSQVKAYSGAGYSGGNGEASRTARKPHVVRRVQWLQEAAAAESIVDLKWASAELLRLYLAATEEIKTDGVKAITAANGVMNQMLKLHGLMVDRSSIEMSLHDAVKQIAPDLTPAEMVEMKKLVALLSSAQKRQEKAAAKTPTAH